MTVLVGIIGGLYIHYWYLYEHTKARPANDCNLEQNSGQNQSFHLLEGAFSKHSLGKTGGVLIKGEILRKYTGMFAQPAQVNQFLSNYKNPFGMWSAKLEGPESSDF